MAEPEKTRVGDQVVHYSQVKTLQEVKDLLAANCKTEKRGTQLIYTQHIDHFQIVQIPGDYPYGIFIVGHRVYYSGYGL